MGFLDDVGKKISTAGKEAMDMAKDLADSAKISSEINEQTRRIEQAYTEIGKKFFELHAGDHESVFDEQFGIIFSAKAQIADLEKKKAEIKGGDDTKAAAGGKFCPSCGQPVGEDAVFCKNCGTKLN